MLTSPCLQATATFPIFPRLQNFPGNFFHRGWLLHCLPSAPGKTEKVSRKYPVAVWHSREARRGKNFFISWRLGERRQRYVRIQYKSYRVPGFLSSLDGLGGRRRLLSRSHRGSFLGRGKTPLKYLLRKRNGQRTKKFLWQSALFFRPLIFGQKAYFWPWKSYVRVPTSVLLWRRIVAHRRLPRCCAVDAGGVGLAHVPRLGDANLGLF